MLILLHVFLYFPKKYLKQQASVINLNSLSVHLLCSECLNYIFFFEFQIKENTKEYLV